MSLRAQENRPGATLREELERFAAACLSPQRRSMRQFAEEEIIIPDGPFEGRLFSCDRQPYSALWFDAVHAGVWNRFCATGPVQSGKTLSCFVIPTLYHLFEIGETVICGLPAMEMAADKWREDLLPAIERSRYRNLLPRSGSGSRGGKVETITFTNGQTLKFMSGGGNDKKRSAFTSRVVVITEADGMDEASAISREADKVTQIEARTMAWGDRKRIYLECSVSIELGRIWQEYTKGTQSKIVLPCPHCGAWSTPEREHLVGWQGAETETEAARRSMFHCPACGESWTEDQRREANAAAKVVHRGQEIAHDGAIHGKLPETSTLGFRWSAVNNMFRNASDIGAAEWRASKSANEDNAEREMRQFVFTIPHTPDSTDHVPLAADQIIRRTVPIARGIIPSDARFVTVGVDIGKWLIHWILIAWRNGTDPHIADYGRFEVASAELGVERAVIQALRAFRDTCEAGWKQGDSLRRPDLEWIDAGYVTQQIYDFTKESGPRYCPTVGRGVGQQYRVAYHRPKTTGATVRFIGDEYHVSKLKKEGVDLIEINADHWKTWSHERMVTPIGQPGALTLFDAPQADHFSIAKHFTSEKRIEEFVPEKGLISRWVRVHKANHWFDCLSLACAAGHSCGVRMVKSEPTEAVAATSPPPEAEDKKSFIRKPTSRAGGGWIRRRS